MKRLILVLALGACGGTLSGVHLESVAESQRRALVTITVPALDRTDAVIGGWIGDPSSAPLRRLLLALHGMGTASAPEVAGDRPIGAVVAVDGTDAVNALAFTLRGTVPSREWLESVGEVRARSGPFAMIAAKAPAPMYGHPPESLYVHVDGNDVIVSGTLRGLLVAGPAAQAARGGGSGDLSLVARPRAWPGDRLTGALATFLSFLRGRTWPASAGALAELRPFTAVDSATAALTLTPAGGELRLQASGGGSVTSPALDRTLADERVAALGALDCRAHPVARGQESLEGSCSIAVHTADEVWSEATSYPLRAGASALLLQSITSALRAGALPGPAELPTDRLLLGSADRTVTVDRVLGDRASPQARHAAAVHGGAVVKERFAVRGGRLLVLSGPHADERLEALAAARPRPLPPELERALAEGRGRGGVLYLDLSALWKPYLKAAQVVQSRVAELVARHAGLLRERRPLVVTVEPGAALDARVSLPPATLSFLLAVASILFAGS